MRGSALERATTSKYVDSHCPDCARRGLANRCQISSTEQPVEVGAVITGIALHVGHFVEEVMTQYTYPRPWILLQEGGGNTYVSSVMPQKRNPSLLNDTRRDASTAITLAMGSVLRAHNITPGMADAKDSKINTDMVKSAIRVLQGFDKILSNLVISPERAIEELNSDWTASQELADLLMRIYKDAVNDYPGVAPELPMSSDLP